MENSYKQVRVLILYDLPMTEKEDIRIYNKFRKNLINLGCYMIQFSVYVKVLKNDVNYKLFLNKLKKVLPTKGEIRVIKITEKQYEKMLFLSGEQNNHEKKVGNKNVVVF